MTRANDATTLHLLGGPRVVSRGRQIGLPEGSKRLVAYVALHGRRVERRCLAEALWPGLDQHRAAGNLRSAVWRLGGCQVRVLLAEPTTIRLHRDVRVDVDDVCSWAQRVTAGRAGRRDLAMAPMALEALDLLPGWYDDWVDDQRERLRITLLQAIDALASVLVRENRCAEAVEAALAAVSVEPLRESAQRALIEAHIAEGNRCEAWRSYASYDRMLVRELGIHPSGDLLRLLRLERDEVQRDAAIGLRSAAGASSLRTWAATSAAS